LAAHVFAQHAAGITTGELSADTSSVKFSPLPKKEGQRKESMRMQKHITVVGVIHIAYAAWGIMWALIIFILMQALGLAALAGDEAGRVILTAVGCIVPGFLFVFSLPGIIGGIGVLRLKSWARYLILVLSVFALFNIPIGTALGIYSIWALMQDETAQLFARGSGP
jgi:hypothetical protein